MKEKLLQTFKDKSFSKMVALLIMIVVILTSIAVAGVFNKSKKQSEVKPSVISDEKIASKSGEVAGASTDNLTGTPSPTPVKSKLTPSPTPALTSTPNNNSGQTPSNNNQPSNSSASNNSASQSQSSTSDTNLSPTEPPTPTATSSPTPVPTPDNTSFDTSWTVTWSGDQVSVVITANKPLKSCEGNIKASGNTVMGNTSTNGNVCTFGGGTSNCFAIVWAKVTSINDETKELSERRSDISPC